jgi:S-adenosylmethionine hydrolase
MAPVYLLTDFGTADTYVGQMKAVLNDIAPGVQVIDLTHEVAPFDIAQGAWLLETALPALPAACVVLAVVDPGVGSSRLPMAVHDGQRIFIGPDNGVLSAAFTADERRQRSGTPSAAHAITNPVLQRAHISDTFHGRDIFAPAAARFASGFEPAEAGPGIAQPVMLPPFEGCVGPGGELAGEVISIDRFGTAITTIPQHQLPPRFTARVADRRIAPGRTFSDVPAGEPVALVDSSGFLAIAINQASAAREFGLERRSPVTVWAE